MRTFYERLGKVSALVLAFTIMLASMAGCISQTPSGSTGNETSSDNVNETSLDNASETDSGEVSQGVKYPIVTDGSITLDYWMPIANAAIQYIETYAENTAYQKIQEVTGIKINFLHPAVGKAREQFNLLIASGDLPDLIQMGSYYSGGVYQGYVDGAYVDLTPYLKDYAPDYYKAINSDEMTKRLAYIEGKVITFYQLNLEAAPPYYRPVLRADWLKEFGMEAPVTLDEYEAYFKAILDNKPGVTPFTTNPTAWSGDRDIWMGAFDMLGSWFVVDGKVQHYYDNPNYKDYLELMNRWYDAGYLSRDFAALGSEAEIYALFDSGKLGLYTQSIDNAYSRAQKIDNFEIESGPYPRKTHSSKLHTAPANWPITRSSAYDTVITTSCKHVKEAIQFLNYGYTEEGSRTYNYGVEGKAWNLIDGKVVFTEFMTNNPDGLTASNVSYIHKIHFGPKLGAPDTKAHPGVASNAEALAFRSKWSDDPNVDNIYRLPPVELTTEEREEVNEIIADVSPYVAEMMLKFIIGAEPLSNFDAYVEKLKEMNFPRAKEIYQAAYDRFMNN